MRLFFYLVAPFLTLIGVSYLMHKINHERSNRFNTQSIYIFVSLCFIGFSLYIFNILFNIPFLYLSIYWCVVGLIGIIAALKDNCKDFDKGRALLFLLNPIIIITGIFFLFNYELIPGFIKRDWDEITMYSLKEYFVIWKHSLWNKDVGNPFGGFHLFYPPGQHILSYFWHMLLPRYNEGIAIFSRLFSFFLYIGIICEFSAFVNKKYLKFLKPAETVLIGLFSGFCVLNILPLERYAEMMSDRSNAAIIVSALLTIFYFIMKNGLNWGNSILAGIIISWASLQRPGFVTIFQGVIVSSAFLVLFFSNRNSRYKNFFKVLIILLIVSLQNWAWMMYLSKLGGENPTAVNAQMIYNSIQLFFKEYYKLFCKCIMLSKLQIIGHCLFLLTVFLYIISLLRKRVKNHKSLSVYCIVVLLLAAGIYLSVVLIGEGAKLHPPFSAGRYLHPIGILLFSFSISLLPFLFLVNFQTLLRDRKWIRIGFNVILIAGLLGLFNKFFIDNCNFSKGYVSTINVYLEYIQAHTKIDVLRLNLNLRIINNKLGIENRRFKLPHKNSNGSKELLIIVNNPISENFRLLHQYASVIFDGNKIDIEEADKIGDINSYDAVYLYDFDVNSGSVLLKYCPDIKQDYIMFNKKGQWSCIRGYSKVDFTYTPETYRILYNSLDNSTFYQEIINYIANSSEGR